MRITVNSVKLVKESNSNYEIPFDKVSSPKSMVSIIESVYNMSESPVEMLVLLNFNTKNKLIGTSLISKGSINASIVSPRDIIQNALLCNATSIAISHNHPSGDPTPSQEDIQVTKRLGDACKIMDMRLLDHIVMGDDCFISLREQGYIG